MVEKFKLLKNFPDIKAGAIGIKKYDVEVDKWVIVFESEENEDTTYYSLEYVNNKPDWFARFLVTTEDEIDIYYGDICWAVIDSVVKSWDSRNSQLGIEYKIFGKKENAEKYLKKLEPKTWEIYQVSEDRSRIWTIKEKQGRSEIFLGGFHYNENFIRNTDMLENLIKKPSWSIHSIISEDEVILTVGGYAKCRKTGTIGQIVGIDKINGLLLDKSKFISFSNIQLLTKEEVISYYVSKGWVKGATFKETCNDNHHVIDSIEFNPATGNLCVKSGRIFYTLKDCELVKESKYPKSYQELAQTNSVKGVGLNENGWWEEGIYIPNGMSNQQMMLNTVTTKQADSLEALAMLTHLHKRFIEIYNEENNCDWKPDWNNSTQEKWVIIRIMDKLDYGSYTTYFQHFSFPTKELVKLFLKYHKGLIEKMFEL